MNGHNDAATVGLVRSSADQGVPEVPALVKAAADRAIGKDAVGSVDSNERGSGARFNGGKVRLDLIPLGALAPAAEVFDYGRKKYAEWNWAKGQPWCTPYASMLRHLAAWHAGEDVDPESGLPHVGHVLCNAIMLSFFMQHCPDMDDRPQQLTLEFHDGSDAS